VSGKLRTAVFIGIVVLATTFLLLKGISYIDESSKNKIADYQKDRKEQIAKIIQEPAFRNLGGEVYLWEMKLDWAGRPIEDVTRYFEDDLKDFIAKHPYLIVTHASIQQRIRGDSTAPSKVIVFTQKVK